VRPRELRVQGRAVDLSDSDRTDQQDKAQEGPVEITE